MAMEDPPSEVESEADNPALALQVAGGATVGANLEAAIQRGAVTRHPDGRLQLAPAEHYVEPVGRGGGALHKRGATARGCDFLNAFLFKQVYDRQAVPLGCQNCYKVRAATRTLRALIAMKALADDTGQTTKTAAEVDNPANTALYATHIYFNGLDGARETFAALKATVDADPDLAANVTLSIKRGCTNYERRLGPSDGYRFDPAQQAVEAHLRARFTRETPPKVTSGKALTALRMMDLVRVAYRVGDETYKDFTDGKPLHEPLVDYAPRAAGPEMKDGEG